MFKCFKFCISFLTRIPIQIEIKDFKEVAHKIYLFPIIGFIIGLIVSIITYFLSFFLPTLLVSIISVSLLIYITGAHHIDGLLDFGDGLMVVGSPKKKIEVMHDAAIGTGGFCLGFVVLISTVFTIASSLQNIFIVLIIGEITANFSMVLICSFSKSANTPMATDFIELNNWKHSVYALLVSILFIFFTLCLHFLIFYYSHGLYLNDLFFLLFKNLILDTISTLAPVILITLICSLISTMLIIYLAYHNFKGVTGDCIGALHEITRLFTMILLIFFFDFIFP